MNKKLAKNKVLGARRSLGAEMEDVPLLDGAVGLPAPKAAHVGLEPALALHMGLPGTQLNMVLSGPHPLLVQLVRAMARAAAQSDHAAELAQTTKRPACRTED